MKNNIITIVFNTRREVEEYQPLVDTELRNELMREKTLPTVDGEGQVRLLVYTGGKPEEAAKLIVDGYVKHFC